MVTVNNSDICVSSASVDLGEPILDEGFDVGELALIELNNFAFLCASLSSFRASVGSTSGNKLDSPYVCGSGLLHLKETVVLSLLELLLFLGFTFTASSLSSVVCGSLGVVDLELFSLHSFLAAALLAMRRWISLISSSLSEISSFAPGARLVAPGPKTSFLASRA